MAHYGVAPKPSSAVDVSRDEVPQLKAVDRICQHVLTCAGLGTPFFLIVDRSPLSSALVETLGSVISNLGELVSPWPHAKEQYLIINTQSTDAGGSELAVGAVQSIEPIITSWEQLLESGRPLSLEGAILLTSVEEPTAARLRQAWTNLGGELKPPTRH